EAYSATVRGRSTDAQKSEKLLVPSNPVHLVPAPVAPALESPKDQHCERTPPARSAHRDRAEAERVVGPRSTEPRRPTRPGDVQVELLSDQERRGEVRQGFVHPGSRRGPRGPAARSVRRGAGKHGGRRRKVLG